MGPLRIRTIAAAAAVLVAGVMRCGAASADVLQTKSDIKGASVVALATLPRSPETGSRDRNCDGHWAQPEDLTALGRQVEKLGWIVTSEAPLGRYRVVTFASGFTPITIAVCNARNSNIAIFDGAKLVALAYAAHAADGLLGQVEPLESGALLVWGGYGLGPVGELHAEGGSLRLTAISPERTYCRHRAVVPTVYGKPLDVARKILIAHGWRPLPPDEKPDELNLASMLARQGVIEAEYCSGVGLGYCKLEYERAAGVLSVTTAGGEVKPGDNTVVAYDVACAAER
jgi:hypothetical protein